MRVTTGMISRQYSRNLNSSLSLLNYYNNRATTLRRFDKVSENPVLAAQSFRLRREYLQNSDYQSNLRDTENLFLTAQSSVMSINTMVQETLSGDCLQAITATTGPDERKIIATKLRKVQESIVATANGKFADRYMFGGSCSTEPPFSIGKDGNLLYRGADVTTGKLENGSSTNFGEAVITFGSENSDKLNGYVIEVVQGDTPSGVIDAGAKKITVTLDCANGASNKDLENVLKGMDGTAIGVDFSKVSLKGDKNHPVTVGVSGPAVDKVDLKQLADEKIFIDLGLGLKFDEHGNIDEQSVFDVAMTGLSFLGYGENEEGIPNNIYTMMSEMADILESPDFSVEKIQPYLKNFEKAQSDLLTNITAMGVKSQFLENTKTRLKDSEFNITVKLTDVEQIDPAMAIMDFKMQEFAYRAALQMGTKILQPTFLDFMR